MTRSRDTTFTFTRLRRHGNLARAMAQLSSNTRVRNLVRKAIRRFWMWAAREVEPKQTFQACRLKPESGSSTQDPHCLLLNLKQHKGLRLQNYSTYFHFPIKLSNRKQKPQVDVERTQKTKPSISSRLQSINQSVVCVVWYSELRTVFSGPYPSNTVLPVCWRANRFWQQRMPKNFPGQRKAWRFSAVRFLRYTIARLLFGNEFHLKSVNCLDASVSGKCFRWVMKLINSSYLCFRCYLSCYSEHMELGCSAVFRWKGCITNTTYTQDCQKE